MNGIAAAILAGGRSRRMGTDKRLALVDGEPMLRRVASIVSALTDELIVVVSAERPLPAGILDDYDAREVADRRADAGPLAAIEAGMLAARSDRVLVVGGDMPWLDEAFLRDLLGQRSDADVVAAGGDRGLEPLLAVYRRTSALAAATGLLDAGERRARALLDVLVVKSIHDPGRSAANVNTPADLAAANR